MVDWVPSHDNLLTRGGCSYIVHDGGTPVQCPLQKKSKSKSDNFQTGRRSAGKQRPAIANLKTKGSSAIITQQNSFTQFISVQGSQTFCVLYRAHPGGRTSIAMYLVYFWFISQVFALASRISEFRIPLYIYFSLRIYNYYCKCCDVWKITSSIAHLTGC
jgi:hypothetical protein